MFKPPILLVGGAGEVGRQTARHLRLAYPTVPLLIGGRDHVKAEKVADGAGHAEGVSIDLEAVDLGIGDRSVSAVAVLFTDERSATLRFARARAVPHVSISPGLVEIGIETAAFVHAPRAAPVVLGTEWLVGATSVPTLALAKMFARLDAIRIGALLDEEDAFGPAAKADLERQTKTMPAALTRHDGAWRWRTGEGTKTSFRAVDGTVMEADAFSPYDVLGLAMATGAPNVEFSLALGKSSSRRRGEPISTEILIELVGEDHAGRPLRTRHAIVHPQGQMPLTGLGVAMILERLVGLDGRPATPAGLYFPHQLLDSAAYFDRLTRIGGEVLTLNPT